MHDCQQGNGLCSAPISQGKGPYMRHVLVGAAIVAAATVVYSQAKSPWVYYPRDTIKGDGGPAPKRDLSGTWAGPGSTDEIPRGAAAERPSLTPLGQQVLAQRKPIG